MAENHQWTDASSSHDATLFDRPRQREGKVPFHVMFLQGISALPGQHKDWAFNTLLLLFYSQVLGLPATYVSGILAIALVFDAVSDPVVGALSDSYKSRWGRRHPLILCSAVPVCVSMYALFSPPETLCGLALAAWLLVATVVLRVSFTFFAVPWGAIGAELSTDYSERTKVIAYRMFIGGFGGVIFIAGIYELFPASDEYANGLFNASNYQGFAIVIAALMLLWSLLSGLTTLNQVKYLPQPKSRVPTVTFPELLARLRDGLSNPNFRVLFVATLIISSAIGTGLVFDTYMNTFFWEFGPDELRWFGLSFLGMAVAIFTIVPLQQRFEKRDILLFCLVVMTFLQISKVALRFGGLLPPNGDPLLLPILVSHTCLLAFFGFVVLMMYASMIADVADEQELQNGLRQEGVFSGGISLSGKFTSGFGLILGGILLEHAIQMPTGLTPGDVDGGILFKLAITDGIIVPALNLVPLMLLLRYTLTRDRVAEIQEVLQARRAV